MNEIEVLLPPIYRRLLRLLLLWLVPVVSLATPLNDPAVTGGPAVVAIQQDVAVGQDVDSTQAPAAGGSEQTPAGGGTAESAPARSAAPPDSVPKEVRDGERITQEEYT